MALSTSLLVGIFVGGQASRFGGIAKGNLITPEGSTVVSRLLEVCALALPGAPVVLVGSADAYRAHGLPTLADDPSGVGPLGALTALLSLAQSRRQHGAIALGCDLPYLSAPLLNRLGTEQPAAAALAPRSAGRWCALTARYSPSVHTEALATLAAGERSFQALFRRLGERARELPLTWSEHQELTDWDQPEDVVRGKSST